MKVKKSSECNLDGIGLLKLLPTCSISVVEERDVKRRHCVIMFAQKSGKPLCTLEIGFQVLCEH